MGDKKFLVIQVLLKRVVDFIAWCALERGCLIQLTVGDLRHSWGKSVWYGAVLLVQELKTQIQLSLV